MNQTPKALFSQSKYFLPFAIALLFAVGFITYSNSFDITFQFDDTHTVQSNIYVRSLQYVPRFFVDATTSSYRPENSGYRPMTTLALALGFQLSHQETWGYHLIKLIEHCLVGVFIFLIGMRLLPMGGNASAHRSTVSLLAGLVFVAHRANTETVDYITAISTLQAGMFYIIAFYLYLRWRSAVKQGGKNALLWACGSVFLYLCSMWSKEEGVTLPAMLFLYEWIYEKPSDQGYIPFLKANLKAWVVRILPWALTAVLFVVLRTTFQPAVADTSRGNIPTFVYFITQFRSWLHYWSLFFFPVNLNADNLSFDFSQDFSDLRVWGALFIHFCIWTSAWHFGKKRRFILFAVAWVYITVLPASSFFPLVEAVNEHRFYIPYMGLSLLSVWVLFERVKKFNVAMTLSVVAIGLLSMGAFARNAIWKTDVSLWEDVYQKNPESPRAMNVLGVSLMNRGDYTRSMELLKKCREVSPNYLPCIVHLSMGYAKFKKYDEGIALIQEGLALDPNYVHLNFHAGLYYKEYFGDLERASQYFMKVYQATQGRFFQATVKLAEIAVEMGRYDEAIQTASVVLQIDQTNGDAWEVYAKALTLKGDHANALPIFQRLLYSAPENLRFQVNVANSLERQGRLQESGELYRRILMKDSTIIQAWTRLLAISAKLKDKALNEQAKQMIGELKKTGNWTYFSSSFLLDEKPRQIKP